VGILKGRKGGKGRPEGVGCKRGSMSPVSKKNWTHTFLKLSGGRRGFMGGRSFGQYEPIPRQYPVEVENF